VVASKYTSSNQLTQYLPDVAAASFSPGISSTAGHIRLTYTVKELAVGGVCADAVKVADQVEWSTLKSGDPATPSLDGRNIFLAGSSGINAAMSLQRLIDPLAHLHRDTDNDNLDFASATPTPGVVPVLAANSAAMPADTCSPVPETPAEPSEPPLPPADPGSDGEEPPAAGPAGDDPGIPADGNMQPAPEPGANSGLLAPSITELLPNPAAPQTDNADEFIELYNPNDATFDASGFVLEVGETTKHRYALPPGTLLPPRAWTALFSSATGLSLSNSGGRAQLFDLSGVAISATGTYGIAADGQAWAFDSGKWQWTTAPTPATVNTITMPSVVAKKTTAAKTTTSKKSAAVKAAATAKSTKKTVQKTPKTAKTAKPAVTPFTPVSATARNPLHTEVLAAVGIFALLYGAYEYRSDIANKFHQFRSHRASRRKNRPGAARRRDNRVGK